MNSGFAGRMLGVVLGSCLAVAVQPARADFAAALADYEAGRHEAAAREFERLAWLGLAQAQSNIALLHVNGLGVPRNLGKAAAWAGIAAQSGDRASRELHLKILPGLREEDLNEVIALERAYQALALEDRLHGEKPPPIDVGPKRLGRIADIYPQAAIVDGWEGFVYVLIGVDERGAPHDAQPLIAQPAGKFDAATVEAMLKTRWEPATLGGTPVAAHACMLVMYQFSMTGDNERMRRKVRELRQLADGGDASGQFTGAVLWAAYPDVRDLIQEAEAQRWMVGALEAQFPPALLMSSTCGVDPKFGPRAVELARAHGGKELLAAARRGSSPAQVLLARALLAAESLDLTQRTRRALGWLELAQSGPESALARIRLAHVLATTPVADLRDTARAGTLYEQLRRTWGFHPLMKETAAALRQPALP